MERRRSGIAGIRGMSGRSCLSIECSTKQECTSLPVISYPQFRGREYRGNQKWTLLLLMYRYLLGRVISIHCSPVYMRRLYPPYPVLLDCSFHKHRNTTQHHQHTFKTSLNIPRPKKMSSYAEPHEETTIFLSNNPNFQSYIHSHDIDTETLDDACIKLIEDDRADALFDQIAAEVNMKETWKVISQWFFSHSDKEDDEEYRMYWISALYVVLSKQGLYHLDEGVLGLRSLSSLLCEIDSDCGRCGAFI